MLQFARVSQQRNVLRSDLSKWSQPRYDSGRAITRLCAARRPLPSQITLNVLRTPPGKILPSEDSSVAGAVLL